MSRVSTKEEPFEKPSFEVFKIYKDSVASYRGRVGEIAIAPSRYLENIKSSFKSMCGSDVHAVVLMLDDMIRRCFSKVDAVTAEDFETLVTLIRSEGYVFEEDIATVQYLYKIQDASFAEVKAEILKICKRHNTVADVLIFLMKYVELNEKIYACVCDILTDPTNATEEKMEHAQCVSFLGLAIRTALLHDNRVALNVLYRFYHYFHTFVFGENIALKQDLAGSCKSWALESKIGNFGSTAHLQLMERVDYTDKKRIVYNLSENHYVGLSAESITKLLGPLKNEDNWIRKSGMTDTCLKTCFGVRYPFVQQLEQAVTAWVSEPYVLIHLYIREEGNSFTSFHTDQVFGAKKSIINLWGNPYDGSNKMLVVAPGLKPENVLVEGKEDLANRLGVAKVYVKGLTNPQKQALARDPSSAEAKRVPHGVAFFSNRIPHAGEEGGIHDAFGRKSMELRFIARTDLAFIEAKSEKTPVHGPEAPSV